MFGYVNVSLQNISDEDKKIYASYYCGLCKAIGNKSQAFRLGLNNDLTFLAVMLGAVVPEEPEITTDNKCIAHAFKKHNEVENNRILEYVSDMNILLVYFKICDDVSDDKKISAFLGKYIFKRKVKQIEKKHKHISETIRKSLQKLDEFEKTNCNSIDCVADCFAHLLEAVFETDFIEDENTKKILSWMGYNIGRWIYIIDAYADVEKDRKKGSYNPFLSDGEFDQNKRNITKATMDYTLSNVANAYDLLKIYRNDTLIRNILYAGLPEKQDSIMKEMEESDGSL